MPLLNCNNEGIACAFKNTMFNRFGTLITIFLNQATKFCGEFKKLSEKTFMKHLTTSWNHLEVDWLAKWMVYMVK
jgi:hypothetical protein